MWEYPALTAPGSPAGSQAAPRFLPDFAAFPHQNTYVAWPGDSRRPANPKETELQKSLSAFFQKEDGAVTVDWVVLTAAVVALNMVILFTPAREAVMNVVAEIGISLGFVSETMRSAGSMAKTSDPSRRRPSGPDASRDHARHPGI
jgi:Flp pilus assembly pilin Flp